MARYNKDTEDKILLVAQKLFRQKGYNGTKTQEIADQAGINKALLHYYFKTKQDLFEQVFLLSLQEVFSVLGSYLNSEEALLEKIPRLVSSYFDYVAKNINLFVFIISEVWQNQDFTQKFVKVALEKIDFKGYIQSFEREVDLGILKDIKPIHFLVNLVSLSIFPFMVSPLLKGMLNEMEIDAASILEERKEVVIQSLLAMVRR